MYFTVLYFFSVLHNHSNFLGSNSTDTKGVHRIRHIPYFLWRPETETDVQLTFCGAFTQRQPGTMRGHTFTFLAARQRQRVDSFFLRRPETEADVRFTFLRRNTVLVNKLLLCDGVGRGVN